jgi:hypothetical protein
LEHSLMCWLLLWMLEEMAVNTGCPYGFPL